MTRRGIVRWLALLWLTVSLGWLGLLGIERAYLTQDIDCELAPGTSVYGEATWSWLPPGRACRFELPAGVVVTEEPPVARVGLLGVLGLWGASLLAVRRGLGGAAAGR